MFISNQISIFITALVAVLLFSCAQDPVSEEESTDDITTLRFPLADERLWTYFSSFEKEAELRGISIDLHQMEITGEIKNIPESNVAGLCQYGRHIHHITIDAPFWNRADHLTREMVVYHELGHCALGLGHREADNNSGACLSIMNSGTTDCNVRYSQANRDYYLDELFSDSE